MLGGFPKADPRYADPEERLAGKCMTCGTVVGCLRRDAVKRSTSEPGSWGDLVSTGCPKCGARVFVMPARDFRKVAEKKLD